MHHWIHPEEPVDVWVQFFGMRPDLPTRKDLPALRAFYRQRMAANGGGIVAIEAATIASLSAVHTLFKYPQDPKGVAYVGSFIIPFRDCSYVLKVQALDRGITEAREAVVMQQLLEAEKIDADGSGWAQDPYESSFQEGALLNLAEAEAYDAQFPKHPLSLVRHHLRLLADNCQADPILQSLPSFKR